MLLHERDVQACHRQEDGLVRSYQNEMVNAKLSPSEEKGVDCIQKGLQQVPKGRVFGVLYFHHHE